jgi:hypothetical protein
MTSAILYMPVGLHLEKENKIKIYSIYQTQLVHLCCRQIRVIISTLTSGMICRIKRAAVFRTFGGTNRLVDEWTAREHG